MTRRSSSRRRCSPPTPSGCSPGRRPSRRRPATASSWRSPPRTGAESATSSTRSRVTTSSTIRKASSPPGSPTSANSRPRTRSDHEPQAHCSTAHPRGRAGERRVHRTRLDLQLPGRARRAGRKRPRFVPRARGRSQCLVHRAGAIRRVAGADRDRRRPAVVRAPDAHCRLGRHRRGDRAGHRADALADPRARLRVVGQPRRVQHRERRPRHRDRRDDRLRADRAVDGARHRRPRPALRRTLVRLARRARRGPGLRRRDLAARSPGRRHRQLLRLRVVEPLADRVRRRPPGARASARKGRGGGVVRDSRWVALGVLCASLLAIVVDNTIVNVALPTLVRELDADVSELQWVVDAYTLAFAGLLLLAGTLGDRLGRRRTLLAGLAVFGLASAAAAFAGGVELLIAERAVMGAGAAFIMPATLSLIVSVFADPAERATAVGIWAATAGLGVALGPVLGGVLLDRFWWGSIFIVNVPLCALAIAVGRRVIPESRDPLARRIDWTGAALSGAGLIALVWAVIEAPAQGWTAAPVLTAGAIAALAVLAFVVQQRRAVDPLLDLRLFRDPRFTAASATIMVLFFALFGFLFLATQYLQFVLGYSPAAAGVRVLPYAGAMIVCATLSAKLVARLGTRRVATAGMALFSAGLAVAATIGAGTGYGRLGIALVLMGAGMGLAGAPATESITASLPPERANIGSAVNDTTRELGGALGVAIVGSIMSSLYATGLAEGLPAGVPPSIAGAARESLGAAVQVGATVAEPARDAFVHAMAQASIVVALIAALGALVAWRRLPAGDVA